MSKSKKKLIAATKAALGIKPEAQSLTTDGKEIPTTPLATNVETPTTPLATNVETQTPAAAPAAPTEKKVRSNRPAGLGHPNAKKLVNPQHTLELKKTAIAKLGGSMVWTNKNWSIKVPAGEFSFPSRELAAFSVATLLQRVEKADQKAPAEAVAQVEETQETEGEATV
jgi:hypothetical protein